MPRCLIFVVLAALAACSSASPAETVPGADTTSTTVGADAVTATSGGPTSDTPAPTGETPAPPMLTAPLTLSLDTGSAISVPVGEDGGVVEATNANGTRFTLVVPPGALWERTTITATPVASVGVDGPEGVVFSPSGLVFASPARLTLTPRLPVPVQRQLLFEFSDDGTELVAAEPAMGSAEMVALVHHFSGFGFADLADRARETYVSWTTDRAEQRIQNELREVLAGERQRQLLGDDSGQGAASQAVTDSFRRYETQVVIPRLEAAGTSCAAAKQAISSALALLRQQQLLGTNASTIGSSTNGGGKTWTIVEIVEVANGPCDKEAIERCRASRDPSILVAQRVGQERWRELLGAGSGLDPDLVQEAEAICDPQAYQVVGGLDDWQVNQTVCDITKPFTLSSDIGTMQMSGGRTGTYTFGGVFAAQYTGTYTISFPEGPRRPGRMVGQGAGSIAGAAGSGTEQYTLTPVGPAC